jgi:CRISPR/Cas system-associated exonuclease Cas4 (RecB family)
MSNAKRRTANDSLDTRHSKLVIRASEIGQYAYCARAWWLGSVMGVPSSNTREMAQGEAVHAQHGRAVWLAGALRVLAIGLLLVAVIAIALSIF